MAHVWGMGFIPNCSSEENAQNMFWGPEDWCSFPGLNLTTMVIWQPIRNSLINRIRQIHSLNKELFMLQMWLSFPLVVVSLPHKLGVSISAGFRVKTFSPNDLFSSQHAQENWEINVRLCSIRRETASVPCHWVGSVRIYEIGISLYSPPDLAG